MSVIDVLQSVTAYLLPVLMGLVGLLMLRGKGSSFDAFVRGAREGLETAVRLVPTLTALLVAVGMLNASGAVRTASPSASTRTIIFRIPFRWSAPIGSITAV